MLFCCCSLAGLIIKLSNKLTVNLERPEQRPDEHDGEEKQKLNDDSMIVIGE
jgi:hypothetical protein